MKEIFDINASLVDTYKEIIDYWRDAYFSLLHSMSSSAPDDPVGDFPSEII